MDDQVEIEYTGPSFRLKLPISQIGAEQFGQLQSLSAIHLVGGLVNLPQCEPRKRIPHQLNIEPPSALPITAQTMPLTGQPELSLPEADISEGPIEQSTKRPKLRLKPSTQRAAKNWLTLLLLTAILSMSAALALRFDLIKLQPPAAKAPEPPKLPPSSGPVKLPPIQSNPQAGQNPPWPQTDPKPALGG